MGILYNATQSLAAPTSIMLPHCYRMYLFSVYVHTQQRPWHLFELRSLTPQRAHRPPDCCYILIMSKPPAPVSRPQTPATTGTPSTSSSNIEGIFDAALKSYKKKTKKDLKNHDLFKQLESCDSPAAILAVFQAAQFDQTGDGRYKKWLVPTLNVLCAFSNALGEGVSLVNIVSSLYLSVEIL